MSQGSKGDFCCLAVDLGAESGRVTALRRVRGKLSLGLLHRFSHKPLKLATGLHWDLEALWQGLCTGLAAAARLSPRPESIGVDGWGVDYVLLSSDGQPLRPPFSHRDPRGGRAMEAFLKLNPRQGLYPRNGIQSLPINTLFQLQAHALAQPQDLAKASSFLLLPDYFHFRLCGALSCERSNASTTQMASAGAGQWDEGLWQASRLPLRLRPALVDAGRVLGPLRPEWEKDFGLAGVPVLAPGTHDTASAVAAAPADEKGGDWAFLSCGTWSLLGTELEAPLLSPQAEAAGFSNEAGLGGKTRFLKNLPGLWVLQRLRAELAPEAPYSRLCALAEGSPALECLFDAGDESLLNPPSMADAVAGLCVRAGGKAPQGLPALVRACLESLALEYRWTLDQLEAATGKRLHTIHMLGGGSQNRLLAGFSAEACGRRVLAGPSEASSLGNALAQALGLGHLSSLEEARSLVRENFPPSEHLPLGQKGWRSAVQRYLRLKEDRVHA